MCVLQTELKTTTNGCQVDIIGIMKKFVFIILGLLMAAQISAQILKERRVYYLDCSYSMVSNKLWGPVRTNLVSAINNINDETIEIIIIPFADNTSTHPTLKPMKEFATSSGKKKLKAQIYGLPDPSVHTKTYHYIPINDFNYNRVHEDRVTYMFLMTDGEDEDIRHEAMNKLSQWGAKYGNKNVYGFYVMLHDQALSPKIAEICDSQDHLWKVKTADVNINLVRLQSSAIFNAKNEKYFDLRIDCGDVSGKSFSASFPTDCPYKVKRTEMKTDAIRVWVEPVGKQKLPVSSDNNLIIKMSGGGNFDFLVTEKIPVKCEFKPERSLKILVR